MSRAVGKPERDDWLPVAAEARVRGVPEKTFLRRLKAMHAQMGGGVLRAHNLPGTKVRKWFFNPAKASVAIEHQLTVEELQEQLGDAVLRIEECEKKDEALRQRLKSLKTKVESMQLKLPL